METDPLLMVVIGLAWFPFAVYILIVVVAVIRHLPGLIMEVIK